MEFYNHHHQHAKLLDQPNDHFPFFNEAPPAMDTHSDSTPISPDNVHDKVEALRNFITNAPTQWDLEQPIQRFPLLNDEFLSCILWNGLFFMTGTDIVRVMVYRFECYGRPVKNFKKFEEGIFSDLRNLKPGIDAILEEPRSEFLEMLYRSNCIRTQKKQKVFFWYSVPHDRLFIDALERDLKRESIGSEPTTSDNNPQSEPELEPKLEPETDSKNETKRHPLCHTGIPRKVDPFLIQDMASLSPGNNNHAIQMQQRQMLMDTKAMSYMASSNYDMDYNGYSHPIPSNTMINHHMSNNSMISNNQLNNNNDMFASPNNLLPNFEMNPHYSPRHFQAGFFQTPPLSDDLGSLHEMVSPSLDLRSSFSSLPFDPQLLSISPNLPESFMTSPPGHNINNYSMMVGNPKSFHPYALPTTTKMNSSDENKSTERPHVCQVEYCGRAFKRSDQLRRHHKTHEHPHPCPFPKCPRSFNRSDQLQQHLALHHPDPKPAPSPPPRSNSNITSSNDPPLLTNLFGANNDNPIDDLQLAALANAIDFTAFLPPAADPPLEPTPDHTTDNLNYDTNFYPSFLTSQDSTATLPF